MRFPLAVCVLVCFVVVTFPLVGQSTNGNINGLVSDASNAAVAGAEIVAVNDATGVQYATKTNSEGIYALPNLPPGPYRIQVSKIGFKTVIKPDIVLNVQDALSINFTIPVGAVFEVLTVQGSAPLVNTESAAVSTVIDQTYVKNMPLNGRSFQDLILLTPGTMTQSSQPTGFIGGSGMTGEISVNGQRPETNYYTVDGVSANVGAAPGGLMTLMAGASGSVPASTALGTTQALVSVDDLQEFRVQTSTYAAEYGRNPGGQFAFETKSGTKQWHGTAYEYLRNGALDANDWFTDYLGVKHPALRQNDFGGTLGGPLRIPILHNGKDRTFFFVSYEGLRLVAPQPGTVSFVPDSCLRGVTANCTGTNVPVPSALQSVLNAFPVPNGRDFADGIAEYVASWSNPSSLNSPSVRFDHIVNDKVRLFFRFSDTGSNSVGRAISNSSFSKNVLAYTLRTYTAGATAVFSNYVSNDLRLNYSSNQATENDVIDGFGGGVPISLSGLLGLPPGSAPYFALIYDGFNPNLGEVESVGTQRLWNLVDTASLSSGHHQVKIGVDYRRLAPTAIPSNPSIAYYYFSQDEVQSNSATTSTQNTAPAYPLYVNFSAFAQDEWRVSRRVSLSFGLRWEVNPPPGVTRGLKPYTLQGSGPNSWTLAPQGTPLWHTTWYNFAPRLGVTYTPHSALGRETVVRGGGGVFFDTGQQLGSVGFQGPGFVAYGDSLPGSFPVLPLIPAPVNPPPVEFGFAYGFAPHLQLPYTLQWNASVEQALGKAQALTVSYVGSHASRLLQQNAISPTNNPNASFVLFVENGLTSDYGALQAQFRRRLSSGLTALASYTWSHCLDFGSQNFLAGYERGNCDFDVRHSASIAFSYDLHSFTQRRFLGAVLDHWGIDGRLSARTAFPVALTGQTLFDPIGQQYNAGLDLVPSQPVYLFGRNCTSVLQALGHLNPNQSCPGGRALNPNAFMSVNSGLGNAPRNFVRGFGAWQMNLALRRDFPIHERLKLQLRAEAFNIFNHPNFGSINADCGGTPGVPGCTNPLFGQATATLANSLSTLNPLYQMGGPRSTQLALKVVF